MHAVLYINTNIQKVELAEYEMGMLLKSQEEGQAQIDQAKNEASKVCKRESSIRTPRANARVDERRKASA